MTKVDVTKSIKIPASKAWKAISSFRNIEDFSPIEKSVVQGEGKGAIRTCYMPDGAQIHELLSSYNKDDMRIQYQITEGPFPVEEYLSTVSVKEQDANTCEINWQAQFKVDEKDKDAMVSLFGGFYNVIIDTMEQKIN